MLAQGVVRLVQNRKKDGKGPLPVAEIDHEFRAFWHVAFDVQQANEPDPVTFLQKWPSKLKVVTHNGVQVVQLASKAEANANTLVATVADGAAPTLASLPTPTASPSNGAATTFDLRALGCIRAETAGILQGMQESVRRQRAFVAALDELLGGTCAAGLEEPLGEETGVSSG